MIQIDPICEVGVIPGQVLELGLRKNYDLQEFMLVGFIIEKFPHDLQTRAGNFLAFVNYENDGFTLIHTFVEQQLLYRLLKCRLVAVALVGLPIEHTDNSGKEFKWRFKMWIQDQVGFDRFFIREPFYQFPTQGRLSGSDLANDDVQSAPQAQRDFEFLKTGFMLTGLEKKVGVRRV
jgi:hypothetical protein